MLLLTVVLVAIRVIISIIKTGRMDGAGGALQHQITNIITPMQHYWVFLLIVVFIGAVLAFVGGAAVVAGSAFRKGSNSTDDSVSR